MRYRLHKHALADIDDEGDNEPPSEDPREERG
jgi:hypothetical protein